MWEGNRAVKRVGGKLGTSGGREADRVRGWWDGVWEGGLGLDRTCVRG